VTPLQRHRFCGTNYKLGMTAIGTHLWCHHSYQCCCMEMARVWKTNLVPGHN